MSWLSNLVGKVPVIGPAVNSVAHNVVDPIARGAVSKLPGGAMVLSVGDTLGKLVPGGDKFGGGSGKDLLAAAQGVNAALLGRKSNELARNALGSVQSDFDSRAPLRQAGQAAMLNPGQGIAAKIAGISQGYNPYAVKPAVAPVAASAPSAAPAPDLRARVAAANPAVARLVGLKGAA